MLGKLLENMLAFLMENYLGFPFALLEKELGFLGCYSITSCILCLYWTGEREAGCSHIDLSENGANASPTNNQQLYIA